MRRTFFRAGFLGLTTLLLCLLLGTLSASAAAQPFLTCQTGIGVSGSTGVGLQTVDGTNYLFLPSAANLKQLTFTFGGQSAVVSGQTGSRTIQNGVPFDLTALFSSDANRDRYPITLSTRSGVRKITVMHSQNLPALFLTSSDASKDRTWVERDKENKAKDGGIVLLRADGTPVYDSTMKNIKGRGNSTWYYEKKPYQIKLKEDVDLLETGIPTEAEGTWVLLANYCDETLLHNSLSFTMADRLGLAFSPHFQPVDLYYDGEYRGTYILCEKTEVSDGRVAVADLEKAFEKANPTVDDFDALPTASGTNRHGCPIQYVVGLNAPADLSGGYLLEIDYVSRAKAEKSWFSTTRGNYVTCKSPEYASKAAVDYISDLFQQFENAVYNGGTDPATGKSYADLVDVDSLARFYLLTELSMDPDSFKSSCYFYKPAGEDRLYAGPVWDFDSGYGSSDVVYPVEDYVAARTPLVRALLAIPSFQQAVCNVCTEEFSDIVSDMTSSRSQQPNLTSCAAEISASQRMNAVLWPKSSPGSYSGAVEQFRALLNQRMHWLNSAMVNWDFAGPFQDVSSRSWYHDAVAYVVKKGLFTGTSNFTFSPQCDMTRAMAVTTLYRLAGEPSVTNAVSRFPDVPDGTWYSDAVNWATGAGIVTGYEDGSFLPKKAVTRQEFAALLYRFAGSPACDEGTLAFPDADTVNPYAATPLCWAVQSGLMQGNDLGYLMPGSYITRAQAAMLLYRYIEL